MEHIVLYLVGTTVVLIFSGLLAMAGLGGQRTPWRFLSETRMRLAERRRVERVRSGLDKASILPIFSNH